MDKTAWLAGALLSLSGCAGGAASPSMQKPIASSPAPTFRSPALQSSAGIESVIGQAATALTRRFGEARIDLNEGDARKLQFTADECVLDVFLYPLEANSTPVATHVEARTRIGGESTDRGRCISAVDVAANTR